MMFLKFSILALSAAMATAQTCENADWCIHFDDTGTLAQIGGTGADGAGNEIVVAYKDVPADSAAYSEGGANNKYFKSTLLTVVDDGEGGSKCGAEAGISAHGISMTSANAGAKDGDNGWDVPLDIDTGSVETGAFASVPDPTAPNVYQIQFCLKTDLMTTVGADAFEVDSASTILSFTVDKEKGFSIEDFAAAPDAAGSDTTEVTVDIAVTAVFCGTDWAEIDIADPANKFKPGSAMGICVSAATGATVADLHTVFFTDSTDAAITNIPIINADGSGAGTSAKTCETTGDNAGKCRVSTIAYARIFERVNAGVLESIFGNAMVSGTAVLALNGRRVLAKVNFRGSDARELQSEETPVNSFDLDVADGLTPPPERSSAPSAAMAVGSLMMTGLVGLLM